MTKLSIAEVDQLPADDFARRFGFLFEHSPWIVVAASRRRPFKSFAVMHSELMSVVSSAGQATQMALLRAHPRLADKLAIASGMTRESILEQASGGLDRLTPVEFATFHELNVSYSDRFRFPFIIAVRLAGGKTEILKAMQARLLNDRETEFRSALTEVGKIVELRLADEVVQ